MPTLLTNPWKQTTRFVRLETPLGPDVLLVDRFTARESISQPFSLEMDLLAKEPVGSLADVMGTSFSITIDTGDGHPDGVRSFHGIVRRIELVAIDNRCVHYRVELAPWLWFLSQTSDCRIFQGQTVPEIVRVVFAEFGFTDFEF